MIIRSERKDNMKDPIQHQLKYDSMEWNHMMILVIMEMQISSYEQGKF